MFIFLDGPNITNTSSQVDQEAPNLARISLKRELWHLNKLGGFSVASVNGVATTLIGELAWGQPALVDDTTTNRAPHWASPGQSRNISSFSSLVDSTYITLSSSCDCCLMLRSIPLTKCLYCSLANQVVNVKFSYIC